MDLRQLKYFKAIADSHSFVRAAQTLYIAQPALSRSIARLEEELGRKIFIRHSGGISLTDAGVRLYEHADQLLRRVQALKDEMAAQTDAPHGVFAFGMPPSLQTMLTAPVAAAFLAAYPLASLNLVQNTSANLREAVANGQIDIAVISTLVPCHGLLCTPLVTESVCLLDTESRWPRYRKSLRPGELGKVPLILSGYPNTLRVVIEEMLAKSGIAPQIRCEVNSASLLTDLVIAGAGAGVLPACAIARKHDGLRALPIEGLQVSWSIAVSQQRMGSLAVHRLHAMLLEHTQKLIRSGAWPTATLSEDAPSLADAQDHPSRRRQKKKSKGA